MSQTRDLGVRRLSQVLKRAREPVFLLDSERRFTYVNPAWEELTGYSSESVLGIKCLPRGPEPEGGVESLGGSFAPPAESLSGQPAGQNALIIHAGGERRWRRVDYWPWHESEGVLIALLGIVSPMGGSSTVVESDSQRLRFEMLSLRETLRERYGHDRLVGQGPSHRRLMEQIKAASQSSIPVLIVGEPGTGRRTVARLIQQTGVGSRDSLIEFDVATLPPEVLDRELFGSTDDVLNGSRFPAGTTVMIGDVVELTRDLQARLAQAVERSFFRLVAISGTDPDQALRDERIREDLYFALTAMVIQLKPLRERLEDIPLFAQWVLERVNQRADRCRLGFSADALEVLTEYDWPGNLGELSRVIEAAHSRGSNEMIEVDDLPVSIRGNLGSSYTPPTLPPTATPLDDILTQVEKKLIEDALHRARHNKSRAAELLKISRPRLYRRIEELGVPFESEAGEETTATSVASGTRTGP